jgi:ligand-binding SRPBCC domain-containing protein
MYQFQRTQRIPATAAQVWDFISSPRNLAEITPGDMGFELTSAQLPEKMHAGLLISYNVRPILGIKIKWVTKIAEVGEPDYFIDEQLKGPYRLWRHEHRMRAIDGGIEMTDKVSYQPPLGIIGRLANELFLQKKLDAIFNYRFRQIEARFGKFK